MRKSFWILAAMTLSLAWGATSFAGTVAQARRFENLMQQAHELRRNAEHARQDGKTGTAKELDRKADSVEARARQAEPADWPPAD